MLTKTDLKEISKLLKFELKPIKSDIEILKSDVGILKSDVGTLKSDVGILKSDVGTLKDSVKKLEFNHHELREDFDNFTILVKNQFDRISDSFQEIKEDFSLSMRLQNSNAAQIDRNTDSIRIIKTKLKFK